MGIIIWIILGLIAGWLASVITHTNSQQGPLMDILLGIVGAIIGGFLMNLIGAQGVTGLNIYSIVVAVIGAVVLIWARRAFMR